MRATVACPKCGHGQSLAVYRYLGAIALRCTQCDHRWTDAWAKHPTLRAVFENSSDS